MGAAYKLGVDKSAKITTESLLPKKSALAVEAINDTEMMNVGCLGRCSTASAKRSWQVVFMYKRYGIHALTAT